MKKVSKPQMNILFGLCILGYAALYLVIVMLDRNPDMVVHIGQSIIRATSFNGVVSAMQVLMCIILVCLNYEKGTKISFVMIGLSLLSMTRVVLMTKSMTPLPGMAFMLITIITLIVLSRNFRQRDIDNITDSLTGLLNRRGLIRKLTKICDEKEAFHVVYVDLDDFKFVNDSLGHKGGDSILTEVSDRLRNIAGKDGEVSRIGGDEFIVLVPATGNEPETVVENVIKAIAEKIVVEVDGEEAGIEVYVTASVGITSYPAHGEDPDTLIKYSDLAMYHSKKEGKNTGFVFNDSLEKEILRRAELEVIIKKSLDQDYFYLVYQPQYKMGSKELRGFETLLRLQIPGGEAISPGEFIPVAEGTDMIMKIDAYVLRRALHEFKEILEAHNNSFVLSINMSAKDICMNGFADKVKKVIEEENFPPQCLEIEITEYCFAQSMETAAENIIKLKECGVQVALDDFGTGYASLSYLSKLPINLLKIDKSFIDHIETDSKSRAFVDAVISIGRLHNCEVISEGVETEGQLKLLEESGCDFVQGYVWGRPLSYQDAVNLCNERVS